MRFTAPWWLLGFLPWLAVTWLLLLRRSRVIAVPTLFFWPSRLGTVPPSRSLGALPLAWLLILAAAGAAVLAAAGISTGRRTAGLRIDFDGSTSELARLLPKINAYLARFDPQIPIIWRVPTPLIQDAAHALGAGSTHAEIAALDRPVHSKTKNFSLLQVDSNPRAGMAAHLRIEPSPACEITVVTVSNDLRQMMITLHNDRRDTQAMLNLRDAKRWSVPLTLPQAGRTENRFVDLPSIPQEIELTLTDPAGRRLSQPVVWRADPTTARVVVSDSASTPLRRFATAYTEIHPPLPNSPEILLTTRLPTTVTALVWTTATDALPAVTMQIQPHAITANLQLDSSLTQAMQIAAAPDGSWQILARADQRPILAVRETPRRQVWIGFTSPSFERSEQLVILLADAVGWLSGGSDLRGHLEPPISPPHVANDAEIERAVAAALPPRRSLVAPAAVTAVALIAAAAIASSHGRASAKAVGR